MTTSTERVEQFKAEIADMRLKDPALGRDRLLLRVGVAAMVGGVATTIGAYVADRGIPTSKPTALLEQGDYQIVALIGLAITVLGAALFLRYSFAQFSRFWLARLVYEQRAQTDRTVEAIGRTGKSEAEETPGS